MPILYKRMNPKTVAYQLFDIDKLDAGPRLLKDSRQREAERMEVERLNQIEARRKAQLDPDYVLDLLNRKTIQQMEVSAMCAPVCIEEKKRPSIGGIALVVSEIGLILFLTAFMIATLFI